MAKKSYVGIGNQSKNIPKGYIGIGGQAKKIVKGYIGVNDVACLFWGGGGVVPEYDYQTGRTYTVHNNFDAEKTMDLCFDEFRDKAISLGIDTHYLDCKYFIDNWELIKELMLNAIDGLTIDVTDISCVIYCNKTLVSGTTYIALRVGDDVFPKTIGIRSILVDDFSTEYYGLTYSRPLPPASDYIIRIYAYSDHHEVIAPVASAGDIIEMGLWTSNTVSRLATSITSFGMKEEE